MKAGHVLSLALLAAATAPGSAAGTEQENRPEVVVKTDLGSFTIGLLPSLAPTHVRRFIKAVRAGDYDHTTFHRIIPGRVIEGGDPISKDVSRTSEYGRGGMSQFSIEHSDRSFTRGTVVAVRCPSDRQTDGVQFFVLLANAPELGAQYTAFGEVVSGMEAVDAIGAAGTVLGQPRQRIEMLLSVVP